MAELLSLYGLPNGVAFSLSINDSMLQSFVNSSLCKETFHMSMAIGRKSRRNFLSMVLGIGSRTQDLYISCRVYNLLGTVERKLKLNWQMWFNCYFQVWVTFFLGKSSAISVDPFCILVQMIN